MHYVWALCSPAGQFGGWCKETGDEKKNEKIQGLTTKDFQIQPFLNNLALQLLSNYRDTIDVENSL